MRAAHGFTAQIHCFMLETRGTLPWMQDLAVTDALQRMLYDPHVSTRERLSASRAGVRVGGRGARGLRLCQNAHLHISLA